MAFVNRPWCIDLYVWATIFSTDRVSGRIPGLHTSESEWTARAEPIIMSQTLLISYAGKRRAVLGIDGDF